jgi:uncharacterized membrane protein YidH (DUF202 family)
MTRHVPDTGTPARQTTDEGLQMERTALAWRRTALALSVATLAVTRTLSELVGSWALTLAGVLHIVVVVFVIVAHRRRDLAAETSPPAGSNAIAMRSGLLPFVVTIAVVAIGTAVAWIACTEMLQT